MNKENIDDDGIFDDEFANFDDEDLGYLEEEDIFLSVSEIAKMRQSENNVKMPDLQALTIQDEADVQKYLHNPTSKGASLIGVKRLLAEIKYFQLGKHALGGDARFNFQEDNLYHWTVELGDFPKDSPLYTDLINYGKKYKKGSSAKIEFEIIFPTNYPFEPPFIRVVQPRFKFMTGHITIGGSICMEILTTTGWVPSYSLENLFIQIKAEMTDGGARLDTSNNHPYSIQEAQQAFNRMKQKYGWGT